MAAKSVVVTDFRTEIPGTILADTWVFPEIITKGNRGKDLFWRIWVRVFRKSDNPAYQSEGVKIHLPFTATYLDNRSLPDDVAALYKVDSGQVGGAVRDSAFTYITSGKNIGRANATNSVCQALRDAYGLYLKQQRRANPGDAGCKVYLPMLADVYDPEKHTLFPVYVQPKYDGIRTIACLCGDEVALYSRSGNRIPGFAYLREDIVGMLRYAAESGRNVYLDGELYKHGVPLQEISGNSRKSDTVVTTYNFMVYDAFIPDANGVANTPYEIRREVVEELFAAIPTAWARPVPTAVANNAAELRQLYEGYLAEGYEGAMIRIPSGGYIYSLKGYRSNGLLKMKPTYDAEYPVVGWDVGTKGKAAGALMIVCQTATGKQFSVTPAMEIADRMEMAKRMATVEANGRTYFENVWKGREITVQYASLSVDGVPLQPRTKLTSRADEPIDMAVDTAANAADAART